MTDTIFALSSGSPPAAIAIIRLSGPSARTALHTLAGRIPKPRVATLQALKSRVGETLDEALVLWLPGPATATGEDCVELHCHGGRAVIAAVQTALAREPGLREAEPGEFTRRAFANGRIDLAQAEALGDLLAAETELQRRVAQTGVGGALSQRVGEWRSRVLDLSAMLEAALDFSDEDDVEALPADFYAAVKQLEGELANALAMPTADRLREGVRVVIGGPPNSGKSSLFNALVGDGAAIVSPFAGTTRDAIERSVAFQGVPFVIVDTAGLREGNVDVIEAIGIERAHVHLERADIILWLGEEGDGPPGCVEIEARCDMADAAQKRTPDYRISSLTGEGLGALEAGLVDRARGLLPKSGDTAINQRQAELLHEARTALRQNSNEILLMAESMRMARTAFDRLLGHAGVENMLDSLFGRFCIGK